MTVTKFTLVKILASIVFIYLVLAGSGCAGEIERRQVLELKKIAAETPIYSGFEKTEEKIVLKHGMVSFFNYYRSTADFSEIRQFYDRVLTDKGWKREEPDEYHRGDYVIAVLKLERTENSFDIVYIWRPR